MFHQSMRQIPLDPEKNQPISQLLCPWLTNIIFVFNQATGSQNNKRFLMHIFHGFAFSWPFWDSVLFYKHLNTDFSVQIFKQFVDKRQGYARQVFKNSNSAFFRITICFGPNLHVYTLSRPTAEDKEKPRKQVSSFIKAPAATCTYWNEVSNSEKYSMLDNGGPELTFKQYGKRR